MTGGSRLVEILILGAGGETASVCEDWSVGWTAGALIEASARTRGTVGMTGHTGARGAEGVGRTARNARAGRREFVVGTS